MYKYLNSLLDSKIYDNFNRFISRKFFKIFKIFFVETKLSKLPENNHPLDINYENELNRFIKYNNNDMVPYTSLPNIINKINIYSSNQNEIKFYDFGGNNLELYAYLNKNLKKKLFYYYHDQEQFNRIVEKIASNRNLKNIKIDNVLDKTITNIDIVYFGSVIQYLQNYKNILSHFGKGRAKYLIISQTPFFFNEQIRNDLIMKQLNLHPIINYLYAINFYEFVNFMNKENFILLEKSTNRVVKFINFKNFSKKFKKIDLYDLIFKYEN